MMTAVLTPDRSQNAKIIPVLTGEAVVTPVIFHCHPIFELYG